MTFALDLSEIEKAISGDIAEFMQKTVFEIYRGVTLKSPVDTGRFKGNWNVQIGAPNYTVNDSATSTPYGAPVSGDVASVLFTIDGTKPVYITNGLPYAARLETGYSKQAPTGMVDVTLTEYRAFIAKNIGKSI